MHIADEYNGFESFAKAISDIAQGYGTIYTS